MNFCLPDAACELNSTESLPEIIVRQWEVIICNCRDQGSGGGLGVGVNSTFLPTARKPAHSNETTMNWAQSRML